MNLIQLPTIEGEKVEAVPCAACGKDATPADVPLCSEHRSAWYGSADWKLVFDIEHRLREAFALKLREQGALDECRKYLRQAVFAQPHLTGCSELKGGECDCGFDAAVAAVAPRSPPEGA